MEDRFRVAGGAVIGYIRLRNVLTHAPTIVRGWGWRALGRCVWSSLTGQHKTFLEIVEAPNHVH